MKIRTNSISEAFDFSGDAPDIDTAEVVGNVLAQQVQDIADDLVRIAKTEVFNWLALSDDPDPSHRHNMWSAGIYSVKQPDPKKILIIGRGTHSVYGFEVLDSTTLKFIDPSGQPGLEGDSMIHFDPFIIYLVIKSKYRIQSAETGKYTPNPSWYSSDVRWDQVCPVLESCERGCFGLCFDFTGNMLKYKSDYPTQITLTEEDCKKFARISIEKSAYEHARYIFRRGWVFASTVAADLFFGWIQKYGYDRSDIDIREYDQRRQFDMRKWRDSKHSYNPEGGWFIDGKIRPKKTRTKPLPRAKDFIIEGFDFGTADDDTEGEAAAAETIKHWQSEQLAEILEMWAARDKSAKIEQDGNHLEIIHEYRNNFSAPSEAVKMHFNGNILVVDQELDIKYIYLPACTFNDYKQKYVCILGMEMLLKTPHKIQLNINIKSDCGGDSILVTPGSMGVGDTHLNIDDEIFDILRSRLADITLRFVGGTTNLFAGVVGYNTTGDLFRPEADFKYWFSNAGLEFKYMGTRHLARNNRLWICDSSRCSEHAESKEVKSQVDFIYNRIYK